MTNPTPHGQVPEALIDLIDAYAETRHRCGGIYNAKTEAARKAVIEALSGVQALSAAPAVHASVKGAMWFTKKPVTIQAIQWTGDNLREVITFTDGPPDTRSHHAGMAWDAYRDLVARDGLKIYTLEGKMLASPGDWIIRGVKGELYPCKPDIFQETYAAASPTPPAEQQAQPGAVYAELPEEHWLSTNTTIVWNEDSMRDFADRTHAARLRCKSEQARLATLWGYVRADATPKQAAPKAAPGVGNSGFDHQTAADFLNGKPVSDEAVRTFVAASRWAHDERAALSATLLAMHGVLTSREAEIALLKKALLEAETAPQPAPDCHHRPPCDECCIAAQGGKDA